MNNVLLTLSIKSVNSKIIAKEIRPSELIKTALKVTSLIKPLNAFVTITTNLAEKQAQESNDRQDDNKLLGQLDGIPIAVKDNFCVSNEPTTCASMMLADFVPGYDATVYKRLRDNGAVLIGKTNLDEFAMGSGTIDSYFGPSKNLWGSEIMRNNYKFKDVMEDMPTLMDDKEDWHIAGNQL